MVGSIVDYMFAPGDRAAALARLCEPSIRIVSMTITEGGYNTDEKTGEFRLDVPEIVHDLQHPDQPKTAFGFIVSALERRRAAGTAPFTVLSCDNLQHNGKVAKKAVLAFAQARDPNFADGSRRASLSRTAWSTGSRRRSCRPTSPAWTR